MFGGLACPAFIYAKPRLPYAQTRASNELDLSFVKNQAFWLFIVANLIQAFANFLPGIYLPCTFRIPVFSQRFIRIPRSL